MKLFSSNVKEMLKEELKKNKNGFSFALAFIIVMNLYSAHAVNKSENMISDIKQVVSDEERNLSNLLDLNIYYDDSDDEKINEDKYSEDVTSDTQNKEGNVCDKITLERVKTYLLDLINNTIYNEINVKDLLGTIKQDFVSGITINNIDRIDFFSIEEKMQFICEKYNLTDFQLKVIISTIYHEAAWTYNEAFRVTTVIYNRTKSKETIRYVGYLTKLDGTSMYTQVIAAGQFDGYLPDKAGYDFEVLLNSDTDRVKLNGILDCLILLKLGEDLEEPFFPFAPASSCIFFHGNGRRNVFTGPIKENDVVDNYKFADSEYTAEITREDVMDIICDYTKKRGR